MSGLISFTRDGWQHAWDGTSLSAWNKCPRYYQLAQLEGWTSRRQSPHLWFGGIYASSLEHFHRCRAKGMDQKESERSALLHCLVASWDYEHDAEGSPIPGTGGPHETDHNLKTRDTLIRSVVWYLAHFQDDPMETIILSDGTPAVELSFAIDFGKDILYCGHIDRLVSYSGGTYVQDQKTCSTTVTAKFFQQWNPDIQMSGYSFAGSIMFRSPLSGVVIDAAQIAVGFTAFSRGFTPRSPEQLDEWQHMMHVHIADAKRAHESGEYPMRPTSCSMYGGCMFQKVCSRHPEHRKVVLESEFVRRDRWDPLKRRG